MRENRGVLRECTYDTSNQPPFIETQTWYKLSPLTEDLVFSIDLFCKKSDFLHQ
ncbi:hypothetical protein FFQ35_002362 [Enterococcus faecium]|nr:hypothetical protein [Enterococcus faecium]MBE8862512.1 hypothetical protein [Enterococcus faecium]